MSETSTMSGPLLFLLAGSIACWGAPPKGAVPFSIPIIDLNDRSDLQTVVDREAGQYLGHVSTVLLEDGKTILSVYPKGHGKGAIVYKKSVDGGKTWSERLPTPANWETSKETPTIHRVVDSAGVKRLILFSGHYPARLAVSEDDGENWSELKPVGDWGGIVVMGSVFPLKTGPGRYMALFHDDGLYFRADGERTEMFTFYKTLSDDGGLTWSTPQSLFRRGDLYLCEPGIVRSPDGKQLAALLRENLRHKNSHVIFSNDEGATWTEPRELPDTLSGDRHTARFAPDGRLFISFRDYARKGRISPNAGDWVGWVGTYEDIVANRDGQYRIRLKDNTRYNDCAYPGVEILPDGTIVAVTYGHWTLGESPYILAERFTLPMIDAFAKQ